MENYRQYWEESFDRLDEYLKEIQAKTPKITEQKKKEERNGRKK